MGGSVRSTGTYYGDVRLMRGIHRRTLFVVGGAAALAGLGGGFLLHELTDVRDVDSAEPVLKGGWGQNPESRTPDAPTTTPPEPVSSSSLASEPSPSLEPDSTGRYQAELLTRAPRILPRSQWAGQSEAPRGTLSTESSGDVRFLLVHHTYDPGNDYTEDQVAGMIRGIFRYHTSDVKGWPDVCYNFFVDRFGRIWEGRAGSLQGPVKPSATGGSQGFSQIACFIGDHTESAPTPKAAASMVSLLAFLARKYDIDPQGMTSFTSRGSNKYSKGTNVRTRTIEGHRAMSQTECPGQAAYSMVREEFRGHVARLL